LTKLAAAPFGDTTLALLALGLTAVVLAASDARRGRSDDRAISRPQRGCGQVCGGVQTVDDLTFTFTRERRCSSSTYGRQV
jgi:hypothetical protein